MTRPDPHTRPKLVTWAYRCWLIAGGLLVALGVLGIIGGILTDGPTFGPVSIGVLVAVIGIAYILMSSKVYTGDARWRSSLSALTLVVVAMLLFFSVGFSPAFAFPLLAALIGVFGSMLSYRPDSEEWFTGEKPKPSAGKVRPKKR